MLLIHRTSIDIPLASSSGAYSAQGTRQEEHFSFTSNANDFSNLRSSCLRHLRAGIIGRHLGAWLIPSLCWYKVLSPGQRMRTLSYPSVSAGVKEGSSHRRLLGSRETSKTQKHISVLGQLQLLYWLTQTLSLGI